MTRHVYSCHVRFSDVDVYGHVNNVKYLEYYQEARLAAFSGLAREGAVDLRLVVAHLTVDYRRPVLFRPEPYVVSTVVTRIGTRSFDLAAAIHGDAEEIDAGEPALSTARAVLVRYDVATHASAELDAHDRARLEALMA